MIIDFVMISKHCLFLKKNNIIKEKLIIDIFNNNNIIRKQNYFISNKNLYLNNSNPFNINWLTINIEFNKDKDIKYITKYKKGYIDNKISDELYLVKPYILQNDRNGIICLYKGVNDLIGCVFYRNY